MAHDKSCPFCNGTELAVVTVTQQDWETDRYSVVCKSCGASCSMVKAYKSYDEAMQAWNTRKGGCWQRFCDWFTTGLNGIMLCASINVVSCAVIVYIMHFSK